MRNKVLFLVLCVPVVVFGKYLNYCEKCVAQGFVAYADEDDRVLCTTKDKIKQVIHSGVFSDLKSCKIAEKMVRNYGTTDDISRFFGDENAETTTTTTTTESTTTKHQVVVSRFQILSNPPKKLDLKNETSPIEQMKQPEEEEEEEIMPTSETTKMKEEGSQSSTQSSVIFEEMEHSFTQFSSESHKKIFEEVETLSSSSSSSSSTQTSATSFEEMSEAPMSTHVEEREGAPVAVVDESSSSTEATTLALSIESSSPSSSSSTEASLFIRSPPSPYSTEATTTVLSLESSTSSSFTPHTSTKIPPFTTWTSSHTLTTFNANLMRRFYKSFCLSVYYVEMLAKKDHKFKYLRNWSLVSPVVLGGGPRCHFKVMRKNNPLLAKAETMTLDELIQLSYPEFCKSTRYAMRLAKFDPHYRHLLIWINSGNPAFDSTYYTCPFVEKYYARILKN